MLSPVKNQYCDAIKQTLTRYMMEVGGDINAVIDGGKNKARLLEIAIRNDDIEFARFLIEQKADPNCLDLSDPSNFMTLEMRDIIMPEKLESA